MPLPTQRSFEPVSKPLNITVYGQTYRASSELELVLLLALLHSILGIGQTIH